MPVVEKIENIPDEWGFTIRISKQSTAIFRMKPLQAITITEAKNINKIEAVWLAVIAFIKWYNQNTQK